MKCPNCGNLVEAVDTLETEYFNGKYYDYVAGTCPECCKAYEWVEVFNYDHDEDIHEIDPNDHL